MMELIILTLPLTWEPRIPLNKSGVRFLTFKMRGRVETGFELKTTYSTMINYHFFQKVKLLGNDEFNHLTIILKIVIDHNKNK
jgi:hypothetical protein